MDSIKDIIPRVIAPLSAGQASGRDIAQAWRRLCGDGRTSGVAAFNNGCLTVHVDCAARRVKMDAQKADYLEALNKKDLHVTDIRFKVGKVL